MTHTPVQTPVLLLWFNRPDLARQVLERLRTVQPARLFVAIDGPRANVPTDAPLVAETVALLDTIDWPCAVVRRVSPRNQGCRRAVSSAIDWFFAQVDEGIILEDDCLPDPTFFSYCTDLLALYRHTDRVMHISGANLYDGHVWGADSYFFSPVPHVWGWASWRRAWQYYDVTMAGLPGFVEQGGINAIVTSKRSARYWERGMNETIDGQLDTWDYQWVYAIWQRNGLCITPNQNLVTNIGYGPAASRTTVTSRIANLPTVPMTVLHHPTHVIAHDEAQRYAFTTLYTMPAWWMHLWLRGQRLLSVFRWRR